MTPSCGNETVVERQNLNKEIKQIFRVGGIAAIIAVLFFRRNMGAEVIQFKGFGILQGVPATEPVTAQEWYSLFSSHPLVGLTLFGLFDMINYLLIALVFLAIYQALKNMGQNMLRIAVSLAFTGITVYYCSNQGLAMLNLSQKYTAATNSVQRQMYLTAGEALLAKQNPGVIQQGSGITISLMLVLLAGLLLSMIMLRGTVFNKTTAWVGILANGIALSYYPILLLAPSHYWLPPTLAAPFRVTWYALIAWKLWSYRDINSGT